MTHGRSCLRRADEGARRARAAAALLGVLAFSAACAPSDGAAADDVAAGGRPADPTAVGEGAARDSAVVFPGDEWSRADPADLGFDPVRLGATAASAQAGRIEPPARHPPRPDRWRVVVERDRRSRA